MRISARSVCMKCLSTVLPNDPVPPVIMSVFPANVVLGCIIDLLTKFAEQPLECIEELLLGKVGKIIVPSCYPHTRTLINGKVCKGCASVGEPLSVGDTAANAAAGLCEHTLSLPSQSGHHRLAGCQIGRSLSRKRIVGHRTRCESQQHRIGCRVVSRHLLDRPAPIKS